ncbi:MAG TPA: FlgD immunoglobulin-like domain containing protein, partial [Verrucomicrobiae bacterium]|nr:FlgD immunoglobulin-like domain containing protein [Verrucomicrobiae bacterium]
LPRKSPVRLEVFNILGSIVKVLVEAEQSAGDYKVHWDGIDAEGKLLSSGIYIYRLKIENLSETKKMILVR